MTGDVSTSLEDWFMAIRLGRKGKGGNRRASASVGALEGDIQRDIKRALESIGCEVTVYSESRRTHIEPGHPDLRVRHAAWQVSAFMETKTDVGRLSKAQREWHAKERAAGGTVMVVRSATEALTMFGALPRGIAK